MSSLRRESVNSSKTSVRKSGSSRIVSCRFCAIRSMKSSAVLAVASWLCEPLDAQLAVAAHRLDEQLLLGPEVVVQQPARDAGLAGDVVEGRAGRPPLGDAVAHRVDDALRLLARQRALGRAGLRVDAVVRLRAQRCCSRVSGAQRCSPGCRAQAFTPAGSGVRRRGGRAVVELLLGPEQEVEHLRAQALVERDREHRAEGDQQQRAAEPAAPAPAHRGTFAQRAAGLAQRVDRAAQLSLQLAVLEQRLAGRLAVAHPPVRAACRAVGGEQVRREAPRLRSDAARTGCSARPWPLRTPFQVCPSMPSRHRLAESLQVQRPIYPRRRSQSTRADGSRTRALGVQRGLLLRRGERPCRAGAALLPEHEPHLLRRAQLRLVRAERRAGLVELQRAEQVDAEEAVLAARLRRRPAAVRMRAWPLPRLVRFAPNSSPGSLVLDGTRRSNHTPFAGADDIAQMPEKTKTGPATRSRCVTFL